MGFLFKVRKTIEEEALIQKKERVLVCVSGGIDSTALLFALNEISKILDFTIGIAHVNHGLRGYESDRDEKFVEELAVRLSLPFFTSKFDVREYAKRKGISLQHAGREIRYDFFEKIAQSHNFDRIAIGHNGDDQVETFFLRVLKGTGIKGLSAIPIKRGKIIRPFLHIYRSEIEAYVRENRIDYVHDSSNDKLHYERNYIRKEIIPRIEAFNVRAKEKVLNILEEVAAINEMFDNKADEFIARELRYNGDDIYFSLSSFKGIDEEVRFRVTIKTLERMGVDLIPLREHMRQIKNVMTGDRPNLRVSLPKGVRVKRVYDQIIFSKRGETERIEGVFPLSMGENMLYPFGIRLSISYMDRGEVDPFTYDTHIAFLDGEGVKGMYVRTFREGDRFYPLGMEKAVKLKDFFISKRIPKELRRNIPLLVGDITGLTDDRGDGEDKGSKEEILWVIGLRIDERHKVKQGTKKVIKVEVNPIR
ncbi:MAG: tRNA lysidine(34) synthetase TilS [Syntrophorhabdaceae bacterium]|nr:tRNA lysidine(34) synthetase TilS [Syntrophorhabdaceae bacterium]